MNCTNFNPRTPSQECDLVSKHTQLGTQNFNPRTPSQECDGSKWSSSGDLLGFQSTHSLTRMRRMTAKSCAAWSSISIHALPHKNATQMGLSHIQHMVISIHALPHKNATAKITNFFSIPFNFLSLLYPSSLENSTIIFSPHHISP